MRTAAKTTLAFMAIALLSASTSLAQIPWQSNLRAAHAQAESQGKLLLLHFYSENCVFCDKLEAGSFKAPQVSAAINQQFIPVKIHGTKNPQLVQMFKVTKYPTDVIVTPSGQTLGHSVSPQEPARYVAMLNTAAAAQSNPPATKPTVASANAPMPANVNAPAGQTGPKVNQFVVNADKAGNRNSMPSVQPGAGAPSAAAGASGHVSDQGMSMPGGAKAALTSSRQPSMNLSTASGTPTSNAAPNNNAAPSLAAAAKLDAPAKTNAAAAAAKATSSEEQDLDLAMQGFCPVTVIKEDRWVEGNPKFGVVHLGKLYLFAGAEAMQTFLADPVPYTPVLNEIDVVRFFEERKIVQGKREWGLKDPTHNRMFFFADEAAMNHFWNEHERYTGAAITVMEKAVHDANPGT